MEEGVYHTDYSHAYKDTADNAVDEPQWSHIEARAQGVDKQGDKIPP